MRFVWHSLLVLDKYDSLTGSGLNPLDCKEIKSVNSKENQSLIFTGRTDAEAEAAVLWPPDAKRQLIGKDPNAGKDWRQEEKGVTEDEMVGWHHRLNGQELEQAPGDGEGQGGLSCCSPRGCKESDMTEQQQQRWTVSPVVILSCKHSLRHAKTHKPGNN